VHQPILISHFSIYAKKTPTQQNKDSSFSPCPFWPTWRPRPSPLGGLVGSAPAGATFRQRLLPPCPRRHSLCRRGPCPLDSLGAPVGSKRENNVLRFQGGAPSLHAGACAPACSHAGFQAQRKR